MPMSAAAILALIAVVGLACQWVAWRVKLPAILFLLLSGIALGPLLGWVAPDALFGELLFPLVSLSVAIILFEGSLTLHLDQIRDVGKVVRRLVSIGAAVTWLIIAVATHWLLGLSWAMSWLFGALVVVTGPTVIVPMLRTVRANSRIGNVLRWEGIIIDPIGALLAVLVYEWIISQSLEGGAISHTAILFAEIVLVGVVSGAVAGYAIGEALRRHWLPEYLQNLATLALVLATFTFANYLAHESGLLAVTVMGMWLANMKGVHIEEILSFKENLTVLLISGLFVLLAARLDLSQLWALGVPALVLLAVIHFVARPIAVWISSYGSDLKWQEKALISWIGPRGIVAAAVSALFALRLEQSGYADAQILTALTFAVIIGTVMFQSATARPLAQWLGVADPEPRGFIIIGANQVARELAKVLEQNHLPVLLVDPSWENIREARMMGLRTFHGNPLSRHADMYLDLVGYGRVLAMSPQRELNVLASLRYRPEFGKQNIFAVQTSKDAQGSVRQLISEEYQGLYLGEEGLTYGKFANLLRQGARLRTTKLTEDFNFEAWKAQHQKGRCPLFALTPKGHVQVFTLENGLQPKAGWQIISFDMEIEKEKEKAQEKAQEKAEKTEKPADVLPEPKPL
ncbi:cation:proton antiporter [Balneatrix alpica]|uniref:Cation:proton antiporter n=1 Tax=Balneatrix alpica TaxID=75684 RepID=A0ABV5ZCF5_9GAMM|nr:sodium:proton antiporter [Balneatrix alpica]